MSEGQHSVVYAHHEWCVTVAHMISEYSNLLRSLHLSSLKNLGILHSIFALQFFENVLSFLINGKYILSDLGYAPTEHIVPIYEGCRYSKLTPVQHPLTNDLAKLLVAADNCNSMLKGNFVSLKELRLVISIIISAVHVCEWISGCGVLHNSQIFKCLENECGVDGLLDVNNEHEPTA